MPSSKKKKKGKRDKKKSSGENESEQRLTTAETGRTAALGSGEDEYDPFLDEAIIDIDAFELPPRDECPLCCSPYPFGEDRTRQFYCCGKLLCRACLEDSYHAAVNQRIENNRRDDLINSQSCPFCRALPPDGVITPLRRLVKMGNAGAMVSLAWATLNGDGVPRNPERAIELYHTAVRAGSSKAAAWLGERYLRGDIVVERDLEKAKRLLSKAARLGNPMALLHLGNICLHHGEEEEALDHWKYYVAAASMGCAMALDMVKNEYVCVRLSKGDYARALRCYQAAHEQTRSASRTRFEERLAANRTLDDICDEIGLERLGIG